MTFVLRQLVYSDIDKIADTQGGPAWKADRGRWTNYLQEQEIGHRTVLLALARDDVIAYGSLLWQSNYRPFRDSGTPEINDLVTAQRARRQGVATRLICEFERLVRESGRRRLGIGVGLYGDYGPAQRLYVSLGFRPDGNGVTYDGQVVSPGRKVTLDDDLVLWFVKDVGSADAI